MKKIWTSIKNKKNLWLFLGIIFLFGIGVGIYFGLQTNGILENTLTNFNLNFQEQTTHFSIIHFVLLCILLISSILIIGIPLAIAYLFYEGISIGFCFTIFTITYNLKGFLFIFLFFLITKVLFLIIYSLFFFKILNLGKSIISWVIYKNNKKDYIFKLITNCLVLMIFLFFYDLLIDLFGINNLIHHYIKTLHVIKFF